MFYFLDGGWSSWTDWGDCSASCGTGIRRRHRGCNNPTPSLLGHDCEGETESFELCETYSCSGNFHLLDKCKNYLTFM